MDTENTETLLLERGGCLHLGPAASDGALCQQVQMAIGISTLFNGQLVDIRHWLPGLVLKVQARRDRNNGERISLEADWPALHRKLTSWIEAPADADMLDLSNDDAYCALLPDTFNWHREMPMFTLICDWLPVENAYHGTARTVRS